jgi:hypothetical protein
VLGHCHHFVFGSHMRHHHLDALIKIYAWLAVRAREIRAQILWFRGDGFRRPFALERVHGHFTVSAALLGWSRRARLVATGADLRSADTVATETLVAILYPCQREFVVIAKLGADVVVHWRAVIA